MSPQRRGPVAGDPVVENPNDCRVAALEDTGDTAEAAAVGAGWLEFDENLIPLHGAVDFIGRDEDIVGYSGSLARIWSDEAVAVAVQVEAAGEQVVASDGCARDAPVFAIEFGEFAAHGQARELLQQEAPLAAPAEAEFAHELLVSCFAAAGAGDPSDEFPIGHRARVAELAGLAALAELAS